MIKVTHNGYGVRSVGGRLNQTDTQSVYRESVVNYACLAYGFLLNTDITRGVWVSFKHFADLIEHSFSEEDGRAAECVRILRAVSDFYESGLDA
jgi:hypothetical protein